MDGEHDFLIDNITLFGIVVGQPIVFIFDLFACPICRRRTSGFTFAPASDVDV